MSEQRNYKGESIKGVKRQLLKPEYGTGAVDAYGCPEVAWDYFLSDRADDLGFDIENIESNGKHIISMVLPKGTIILRYGNEFGRFTAPGGTLYEELALPFIPETMEYNEYEVLADGLTVFCMVDKGKVAPCIDGNGGGIQYYHEVAIKHLVDRGVLRRLDVWA